MRYSSRFGMNAIQTVKMNVRGSSRFCMKPEISVNPPATEQLVDGDELLKIMFPPKCRPTLRWLRDQQKTRRVPFIKMGRLVFFDPVKVREALNGQRTAKFGGTR